MAWLQVSELQLRLRDSSEDGDDTDSGAMTRTVWHLQFLSWPDYGVPESAFAMLSFRDVCLQKQRDTIRDLENHSLWSSSLAPQGPPIVVHCSAGIGRTGRLIKTQLSSLLCYGKYLSARVLIFMVGCAYPLPYLLVARCG